MHDFQDENNKDGEFGSVPGEYSVWDIYILTFITEWHSLC